MAVYLNNVALFIFALFTSIFCAEEIVTLTGHESDRIESSEWLRKYVLVPITVCSSHVQSLSKKTMYFSAAHNDFIIDLFKEIPVSDSAYVRINKDRGRLISAFTDELGVYRGSVRKPCCGHKAVIKLTSEGLDATIHTSKTIYFLEPESRWILSASTYTNTTNSTCENFSCILYEPSDVVENMTSTAADVTFALNDILRRKHEPLRDRVKRSFTGTRCSIQIVADHTFHEKIGLYKLTDTISSMMFLISETNIIFQETDFDGDGNPDNVGVYVDSIIVYTEPSGYLMENETDHTNYLNQFSKYDHETYCLAVAFSSKGFPGDVMGLSWQSGICRKRVEQDGELFSFNTCFVTTHSSTTKMSLYSAVLTMAHEFGHSFGSPHDDISDTVCSPGGSAGSYIMSPMVIGGDKPNHFLFSSCSISHMYPVIRSKTCLEPIKPVCGNGIKEAGEICDCGTTDTCMNIDPCCVPIDIVHSYPDLPCTINKHRDIAVCSAKTSPCCTDTCQIEKKSNKKCGKVEDCISQSYCNGKSEECPETFKPDKTMCDNGRRTCSDGRCVNSICLYYNAQPCTCSEPYECYDCCMDNSSDCSQVWSDVNFGYLASTAGVSCSSGQGYCDGNGNCIMGDQQATLDRLMLAFTEIGISRVRNWFSEYWYYVVTGVMVLTFFVIISVTTCGGTDFKADAYAHAQFLRVAREADIQKHHLEKRRKDMQTFYRMKIEDIEKERTSAKMNLTEAFVRMITFFPTAPRDVLDHIMKMAANEDTAVKLMLLKNYPFQRLGHSRKK